MTGLRSRQAEQLEDGSRMGEARLGKAKPPPTPKGHDAEA